MLHYLYLHFTTQIRCPHTSVILHLLACVGEEKGLSHCVVEVCIRIIKKRCGSKCFLHSCGQEWAVFFDSDVDGSG